MTADRRTHQVTPCQPGERPVKRCNGPNHNGEFLPVEAFGVRTQKNRQGNFYRNARCFECNTVYGRELYQKKHPGAAECPAPAASAPISSPPRHAMERGPGGEDKPARSSKRRTAVAYTAAGTRITLAWISRHWIAAYDEECRRYVEPATPQRLEELHCAGVLVEALEVGGRI